VEERRGHQQNCQAGEKKKIRDSCLQRINKGGEKKETEGDNDKEKSRVRGKRGIGKTRPTRNIWEKGEGKEIRGTKQQNTMASAKRKGDDIRGGGKNYTRQKRTVTKMTTIARLPHDANKRSESAPI